MRATDALAKLIDEIDTAHVRKLVPTAEALAGWRELVHQVRAEAVDEWMLEALFRLRTGASARWCRAHFGKYEKLGLARRGAKEKRIWNVAVRVVKRITADDPETIKNEIAATFRLRSA